MLKKYPSYDKINLLLYYHKIIKGVIMNKFLENLNVKPDETFAAPLKEKCQNFVNAHPEITCLTILAVACFFFLFVGINLYPLMDVDETRYAVMSRDLINSFDLNSLMLNGLPFLEKPPLYFWLVGLSIKLFGGFSAFAVRFPIALLSTFLVFFTYYVGKRIISRKFGTISALILLSSVFFLILSHIAILDMVLTVFMTSAIYSALLTNFCQEKNKKYYWWYFYVFMGLGFLSKGILALAIPAVIIFIYALLTKTAKEIFKPINILPGIAIFFAIAIPWHYMMYQEYGFRFIKEYFLIHHFARLMGAEVIGRERPFWYFVPVFLLGFLPWSLNFIAFVADACKKLKDKFKNAEGKFIQKFASLFTAETNEQKLLLFSSIFFVVVFLVFSTSGTKLPTYILPAFPAAALLTGYYWWVADEKNEHEKGIYTTTIIFTTTFIVAALTFTVAYYFLPFLLQEQLDSFKHQTTIAIYLLCIFLLLRLNTKRALSVFSGYILFMFFVIMLAVTNIFNFVYSTGQNELEKYAIISAYPNMSSQLVTFDFAVKPSTMVEYNNGFVIFITDPKFDELDKKLQYKKGPTFVIVKNKNLENDTQYQNKINQRLELIEQGSKYSLYVKDVNNEYKKARPRALNFHECMDSDCDKQFNPSLNIK